MVPKRKKGSFRYLVLAIIPQAMSKGFEAMGDRAAQEAGVGNGAGVPYYLVALVLTVIALGLCLFALKRIVDQLTGKDKKDSDPKVDPQEVTRLAETFADKDGFDPDAVMRRYLESRPSLPTVSPAPARPSGFGKKGL
jgi:hypothetical protein